MKSKKEILKEHSIVLKRNREEEINLNYKKIYDLSKIDNLEELSFEEKKNLLITIKKVLLCTNDYISSSNILEILKYFFMTTFIFILYIIIYSPIYKTLLKSDLLQELSLLDKIYYYFFFDIIEIAFRIVLNAFKRRKVKKIMRCYAKSFVDNESENIFNLYIDRNFNLYIIRKNILKNLFNFKEETKSFLNEKKYKFYQYVINYPNCRYYEWDRKILNEKEKEIADNIIKNINLAEKEHVKKFGFSVIVVFIFYVLSFNSLIRGEKKLCLLYRFIIFVMTKIFSYLMTFHFKNDLMEKEEIISKQYLPNGYFIILSFTVIQIFKLKDEYIDASLNINENYKNIHKNVDALNDKFLQTK